MRKVFILNRLDFYDDSMKHRLSYPAMSTVGVFENLDSAIKTAQDCVDGFIGEAHTHAIHLDKYTTVVDPVSYDETDERYSSGVWETDEYTGEAIDRAEFTVFAKDVVRCNSCGAVHAARDIGEEG